MRVVLAGYNVDARVLRQAEEAGVPRERLTPEVLSAAYARISRDARPVGELRRIALEEVEKARASNRRIIFEMGHHSVAEHAVFNFDVTGISRLAIESLERFRLCSFTEKSQRYITLDHDFALPEEVRGTDAERGFLDLVTAQAGLYDRLYTALRARISRLFPEMESKRAGRRTLDGLAKEDARYATILATTGQLGLTLNARNLELVIRRFAAHPLAEVRAIGRMLYREASAVAPSLLLFTEPTPFDAETPRAMAAMAREIEWPAAGAESPDPVSVVRFTPEPDRELAAALLHSASGRSFAECRERAFSFGDADLRRVVAEALARMEFYDAPPRELEHVSFTFELVVSASCFAQLKRHRMATQTVQPYDPALGVMVPDSIADCGLEEALREQCRRAEDVFDRVARFAPDAAPYALTNAHRRRVLYTADLRDLYHTIRLREDSHAQWDIRRLAERIRREVERIAPLGAMLLCGKDRYADRFEAVFGRRPAADPGATSVE